MAIARGAGTEILRSHLFEDLDNASNLIHGVQHHIYTVLSVICSCVIEGSLEMYLNGYDSIGGTTNSNMTVFQSGVTSTLDTFVWNDKFSFTGTEPSSNSQDAHADQGTTTAQLLKMNTTAAADNCTVIITYIDQNNA